MNENYNQIFDEGKSVSIVGLCAYVLKKWKLMVIVALVAAIAAGGMSFVLSKQAYETAQNATGIPSEPAISDYDKEVVLTKMDMMEACRKAIGEYSYYYDNSIKAQLNPNSVPQGTINYVISGTNTEEVMRAVVFCEAMLLQEERYAELSGKLSIPSEPSMLREVAWMTATYMEDGVDNLGAGSSHDAKIKFVVRHYNYEDCEIMLSFFEEQMKECVEALAQENIQVTMKFVSSEMITCCDRSLATLSKDVRNGELSSYEVISNLKKNMSEEQTAYYEYLLKMEEIEVNGAPAVVAEAPSVDILLTVIAAVAGAVCVAVLYAALYLFGGRVHNVDELKSWISAPVIEAEAGAEMVAAILEGIAVKSDKKKIYLTGSMAESNAEFIKQLKNVLATKGMEAMSGGSLLKDAKAFEEAASCGAVMLLEKCNVSKEKDLKETIVKAASCGIQVLGIVLEK